MEPAGVLQGRYRILHLLGEGGMGKVYLAEDLQNPEPVALKFLQPQLARVSGDYFREEVKILSRLSHPHLVKIFDFYEGPEGPFFVMEYLKAQPLNRDSFPNGEKDWASPMAQACQGLHYLHSRNILHRDLKPSNLLVTESGELKILDFGLAAGGGEGGLNSLGTLAYMPPEAFWGEWDSGSDLFSLGVSFYEVLSGQLPFRKPLSQTQGVEKPVLLKNRRPDLPEYFTDLIDRMIALQIAERPKSPAGVIRYLNQHVEKPFPLIEEKGSEILFKKIPWVGREEELKTFRDALQQSITKKSPRLISVSGPTGVGRSRFLEEIKWPLQLSGIKFLPISPPGQEDWLEGLYPLCTENPPTSTDLKDLPSRSREVLRQIKDPTVVVFTDLHQWPEAALSPLEFFLRMALRAPHPVLWVLEFNHDFPERPLGSLLTHLDKDPSLISLDLKDLKPQESQRMIEQATPDAPLPLALVEEIVKISGGRPLLIVEALRHTLTEKRIQKFKKDELRLVPRSLEEVSAFRVKKLPSEEDRYLLALLACHPEGVLATEVTKLWKTRAKSLEDTLLELDREGFLSPRTPGRPTLDLRHPSLRGAYLKALPPDLLREVHQRWVDYFLQKLGEEPKSHPEALKLADHAYRAQDRTVVKRWGPKAAEVSLQQGEVIKALEWYRRLVEMSDTRTERAFYFAHEAPLLYRLGRYDEALRSYDSWFAETTDDGTEVQKVKYHLYSSLTLRTAGRIQEAKTHLQDCLATGDTEKHPHHRPYHARAHLLLAAFDEKEERMEAAQSHLTQALKLASENPMLLGEIEQRLGVLSQQDLRYDKALHHFKTSLHHYQKAGHSQAQAIAHNSVTMLLREQGNINEALAESEKALKLGQQGGDLLQIARYQENRALLALDGARYAEAGRWMEEAQDVIEQYGDETDRLLRQLHGASLSLGLGNFKRCEKMIGKFEGQREALNRTGLNPFFDQLQGDLAYFRGNFPKAEEWFSKSLQGNQNQYFCLMSRISVFRARARQGLLQKDPLREEGEGIPSGGTNPSIKLWRAISNLLTQESFENIRESDLVRLLNLTQACELPEIRMEALSLLSQHLKQKGLCNLADRFRKACQSEWERIFHTLPEEFKMDFEKNRDLKTLDQAFEEIAPSPPPPAAASAPPRAKEEPGSSISKSRFRQYSEINRQIAKKTDLNEILERVMDAAIEITGAERGFLLLKNEEAKSKPLSGFEVKTARHFNQRTLNQEEFQFSMSAVRQAMDQGAALLTDNAQVDPRFQEKKSVMQYQLKSILVIPLEIEGEILGALYLDHRYQPECFSEEDMVLLSGFAAQASLAIEKAQMVQALKAAKEKLEVKVTTQAKHIQDLSTELAQVRDQLRYGYEEIVGQSPPMMQVFQLLDHVTETTIPVWILGESGTGKELIAHSLHHNSPRKTGPFVAENVGAIPETLLESELFGHKKGAFTHADRDRVGLFEQASGGTLFLDEIADMSMGMQVKLLRVLQEGEVRPIGANKKVKIDVRLVTASNRDLNRMVKEGKFRQDLFFRINGLTIKLPPLRERKDDIPLLIDYLTKKISRDFKLAPSEMSDEALQLLLRYEWPGNIRELEGILRNALLFARGRPITPELLSLNEGMKVGLNRGKESAATVATGVQAEEDSAERQMILELLRKHQMNKEKAAEELGISLRNLYTRMERHRIPKKKTVLAKYLGLQ